MHVERTFGGAELGPCTELTLQKNCDLMRFSIEDFGPGARDRAGKTRNAILYRSRMVSAHDDEHIKSLRGITLGCVLGDFCVFWVEMPLGAAQRARPRLTFGSPVDRLRPGDSWTPFSPQF